MFSFGDLADWGGGFGAALACRPGWLRKAIRAAAQQGLRAALGYRAVPGTGTPSLVADWAVGKGMCQRKPCATASS